MVIPSRLLIRQQRWWGQQRWDYWPTAWQTAVITITGAHTIDTMTGMTDIGVGPTTGPTMVVIAATGIIEWSLG
ncbi:MAG: hypothetical protein V4675_01730 [Verrucomicrobiota bacterium]